VSDLASELEAIRTKHGKLTPTLVLDEARDPSHPLHDRFEWDDEVAGEAWRLEQARVLIVKVRYRFEDEKGKKQNVRRFYALRASDADEYDYEDIESIMADAFRRKLLLNEMQRRIDELVRQYGQLQEFWALVRKIARRKKVS
jgi:hypothetical protein